MMGYLAVTAGVGCASSAANAAVVFYGNAGNTNIQADPRGVFIARLTQNTGGSVVGDFRVANLGYVHDGAFATRADAVAWTRGSDLGVSTTARDGRYGNFGNLDFGAVLGSENYANVSFNGVDGIYEAVAQFYLDGAGGGYLMAIATTNPIPNPQDLSAVGGPALSISAGKAMIDAAAVPEPTSLGLLALGAMGLATRRQRRKAA